MLLDLGTEIWYPFFVTLLQLSPVLHGQQETGPQFSNSNKTKYLSFTVFQ